MHVGDILVLAPLWSPKEEDEINADIRQEIDADSISTDGKRRQHAALDHQIRERRQLVHSLPFASAEEYRYYLGDKGLLRQPSFQRWQVEFPTFTSWKAALWTARGVMAANTHVLTAAHMLVHGMLTNTLEGQGFLWTVEAYKQPIPSMPAIPGMEVRNLPMPSLSPGEIAEAIPRCPNCGNPMLPPRLRKRDFRHPAVPLADSTLVRREFHPQQAITACGH